eukprot:768795-Hanusia_phi.AAC.7
MIDRLGGAGAEARMAKLEGGTRRIEARMDDMGRDSGDRGHDESLEMRSVGSGRNVRPEEAGRDDILLLSKHQMIESVTKFQSLLVQSPAPQEVAARALS